MNKLYLFLVFAVFALVACSEEKPPPTQTEICAKIPITKECLIGKWYLDMVDGGNSECNPTSESNLELQKNGRFIFNGAYGSNPKLEKLGAWELIGGGMKITFDGGDYDPRSESIDATLETRNTGHLELRINTKGYTGFLQCNVGSSSTDFTEIFSWNGKSK